MQCVRIIAIIYPVISGDCMDYCDVILCNMYQSLPSPKVCLFTRCFRVHYYMHGFAVCVELELSIYVSVLRYSTQK